MQGDQLARQWRILQTMESRKNGATVAELAAREDRHPGTIWQDLDAIQNTQPPSRICRPFLRKHIARTYIQICTSEGVSVYLTGEIGFDIKEPRPAYGKRIKRGQD